MKISTLLVFCFFSCVATAFGQQGYDQTSSSSSISSVQTMHAHFDKDIYLPGETIWFKIYLYNINEISLAATNFYVAIYDDNGTMIEKKQFPVIEGACHGDLKIPDTIKSNRLRFLACTKAMVVDNNKNYYQKVLDIYQGNNSNTLIANKVKSLQFFAEGGQVITELENHLAFKANYSDGAPATINGSIIDSDTKDKTDTFFTNNMGLGEIIFTPQTGKKYTAIWKDQKGIENETPLPESHEYGATFHVATTDKKLQFSIVKNKNNDSLSVLHLLAQMGNYQVYKADLTIENDMELAESEFATDSLSDGLMQLTLLDKYYNVLQQRLVFINHHTFKAMPVVVADTVNLHARGKNVITISLQDTMFTNLSVSVTDINFKSEASTYSMLRDLHFDAQMNGLNQNIDSLVKINDAKTLNLLTLAYPWKKYSWQNLVNRDDTKNEPLDNYLALQIDYSNKGNVLPNDEALNIIIDNKNTGKGFFNLKPADKNTFIKNDLVFFDSVKIVYQLEKNKELVHYLKVKRREELSLPATITPLPGKMYYQTGTANYPTTKLDTFVLHPASTFNGVKTIKEVVVITKKWGNPKLNRIEELDNIYTFGLFSGITKGYQLNLLDDPMVSTNPELMPYILYRVSGLRMGITLLGTHYFYVESFVGLGKLMKVSIPVFINEVETDYDELDKLSINRVAYVKYIPGIVIGNNFRSTVGAVYVYTKKGNETEASNSTMGAVKIKGYDRPSEFIVPPYSNADLLRETDLRTTIYWNPELMLDKNNNKARIEFYNNDVSKKLLLKIEGVNAAGQLVHIEKLLQ